MFLKFLPLLIDCTHVYWAQQYVISALAYMRHNERRYWDNVDDNISNNSYVDWGRAYQL